MGAGRGMVRLGGIHGETWRLVREFHLFGLLRLRVDFDALGIDRSQSQRVARDASPRHASPGLVWCGIFADDTDPSRGGNWTHVKGAGEVTSMYIGVASIDVFWVGLGFRFGPVLN